MNIKPATALRNEYNKISTLCKETQEPVYLTKNGEGDLVVMDIAAFEKRERFIELREKLLEAEEQRLNGTKTYSPDEVRERFRSKTNA